MNKAQRRAEGGFTLISVMIALVMLTVGLMALAKVQTSLVRTERDLSLRQIALSVARSYTEELRSRDPWSLVTRGAGQGGSPRPGERHGRTDSQHIGDRRCRQSRARHRPGRLSRPEAAGADHHHVVSGVTWAYVAGVEESAALPLSRCSSR